MKVFIVLAAVVAVACANAVGRSGWGSGGSNKPSIDLELLASAAAAGAGNAAANQAVLELVSGNPDGGPALLSSVDGVLAAVAQGEDISQVSVANKPSGATSTVNTADVYNEAIAEDTLEASLSGANYAAVQNSAASDAAGEGAIASEASSLNVVEAGSGSGWRRPQ